MTQEYLKSILRYNPSTGVWKWRVPGHGRRINSIAGYKNKSGYIMIMHKKKLYQAHRLAFLYMYGYLPENFVDHINRNPMDNRWDNLREVSAQCNAQNSSVRKRNNTGITGVRMVDEWGGYTAYISHNGKTKYLGYSTDLTTVVKIRWEAEKKYNFNGCNATSTSYLYLKEKNLI